MSKQIRSWFAISFFLLAILSLATPFAMLAFKAEISAKTILGPSAEKGPIARAEARGDDLRPGDLTQTARAAILEGVEKERIGLSPTKNYNREGQNPKISIIIDDLGGDLEAARALLSIDAPINFAILPYQKFSGAIAREARSRGATVLLHAPMEPHRFPEVEPGRGALLTGMSASLIERELGGAYESLGSVEGLNNHMGSKFTEDPRAMRAAMNFVRAKGLFFVDSLTSGRSIAYSLAKSMGLRAARRDVFLDNEDDLGAIVAAIGQLAHVAGRNGRALGIGHPRKNTIEALAIIVPRIKSEGFEIVPVGDLLN